MPATPLRVSRVSTNESRIHSLSVAGPLMLLATAIIRLPPWTPCPRRRAWHGSQVPACRSNHRHDSAETAPGSHPPIGYDTSLLVTYCDEVRSWLQRETDESLWSWWEGTRSGPTAEAGLNPTGEGDCRQGCCRSGARPQTRGAGRPAGSGVWRVHRDGDDRVRPRRQGGRFGRYGVWSQP